jgi:DNA-binding MarR family transcriptional regulator
MSTLNTSRSPASTALSAGLSGGEDRALIDAFERLGPAYMRWVRSQTRFDATGVTVARLRTLALIRTLGPRPMGQLAKEAGVAARTLTALIDGLERDGLARRVPHPSDRRATLIEITDEGEQILRSCLKPHRASISALFSEFGRADRTMFARLIPLLVDAIEARTVRKT